MDATVSSLIDRAGLDGIRGGEREMTESTAARRLPFDDLLPMISDEPMFKDAAPSRLAIVVEVVAERAPVELLSALPPSVVSVAIRTRSDAAEAGTAWRGIEPRWPLGLLVVDGIVEGRVREVSVGQVRTAEARARQTGEFQVGAGEVGTGQ